MAIFDFFLSRNRAAANVAAYIGHVGRMFYDSDDGTLKISDGVTPGGINVTYPVATETTIGGIKAGPGANVAIDGTLTIDTSGLPLSIGNLLIEDTTIKTLQPNRDLFVVSNGTGNVSLVGEIHFYKPNGFPPTGEPYFRGKTDGQLRILVPAEDPLEGGVEIIGSATGTYIAPGQPGAMLQLTGNPDVSARVYLDSLREYASFVGRRYNGTTASPGQVLADQDVLRINATAATNAGMGNVALAQIQFRAIENQTTTAQGSSINLLVTPVGSPASSRVEVANVTVANGVGATKFTTTGNVTAGNVVAGIGTFTGNVTAGNISTTQINSAGAIISADGIYDSAGALRSIPQNSKNTGYTLQSTDNGQMINITTGNVTVPAGVFNSPFGQTVSIFNNQTTSNAVVQGSGVTLRLAGTAATGSRTLARYGVATLICVAANTFVISGAGLS
jgi:hypothetical protein